MAQKVKTLVAITEDLALFPGTYTAAHNHLVPEDQIPSSALCKHEACMWVHIHTHKQHTQNKINKSKKKFFLM